MQKTNARSISRRLERVPAAARQTVNAARRVVKAVAPRAVELAYQSQPPRSPSALWKLARYAIERINVVGIGAFRTHALLFFYRGLELDDRTALLEGGGKAMRFIRLRSPADARRAEVRRTVRKAFKLAAQEGAPTIKVPIRR
jgi:hypothetical protein